MRLEVLVTHHDGFCFVSMNVPQMQKADTFSENWLKLRPGAGGHDCGLLRRPWATSPARPHPSPSRVRVKNRFIDLENCGTSPASSTWKFSAHPRPRPNPCPTQPKQDPSQKSIQVFAELFGDGNRFIDLEVFGNGNQHPYKCSDGWFGSIKR